jgi:hypothetical protein
MITSVIPKSATNRTGLVEVRNNNFKEGQVAVVFGMGIGERGSGSQADLNRVAYTGYFNLKNDPQSFAAATDNFTFNIVAPQTVDNYAHGEYRDAYNYAINVLKADPNNIHLVVVSNGGYGLARWTAIQDPELLKLFATITPFVMGPGTQPGTAKALADSGRPIWFFTSANDHSGPDGTNSGTSFQVTDDLFNEIKAMTSNVWETKFNDRGHGGTFTTVASAWGNPKGKPGAWSLTVPGTGTIPKYPWYQFLLNNSLDKPIRTPLDPPQPVTAPVPVVKVPKFILYEDGSWEAVK